MQKEPSKVFHFEPSERRIIYFHKFVFKVNQYNFATMTDFSSVFLSVEKFEGEKINIDIIS